MGRTRSTGERPLQAPRRPQRHQIRRVKAPLRSASSPTSSWSRGTSANVPDGLRTTREMPRNDEGERPPPSQEAPAWLTPPCSQTVPPPNPPLPNAVDLCVQLSRSNTHITQTCLQMRLPNNFAIFCKIKTLMRQLAFTHFFFHFASKEAPDPAVVADLPQRGEGLGSKPPPPPPLCHRALTCRRWT